MRQSLSRSALMNFFVIPSEVTTTESYAVDPEPVPLVAGGYMHDTTKHVHESDLEWRRFWTTAPGGTVED